MKNENSKNIIIVLMSIVIVILLVLVVLFATNTISFNSNDDEINKNDNNSQITENDNNENIQSDLFDNSDVDNEILSELYGIIGIFPINQYYINDCLNVAISNNNYKDNFKSIFSWYALLNGLNTNHYEDTQCQSSEECKRAYSCAACYSIAKNDADEILRMYNFDNDVSDFLTTLPAYNNEYAYGSRTNSPAFCEFEIKHNTSSEYINSSDIRITDNQNITEYEYPDDHTNIVNSINQTVTYDFKKDTDGNYYLSNVDVK